MIQAGDKVFCIQKVWNVYYWMIAWGVIFPKHNYTYTVREVREREDGRIYFLLYEIRNPYVPELGGEVCFSSDSFRKVESSPVEYGTITSKFN